MKKKEEKDIMYYGALFSDDDLVVQPRQIIRQCRRKKGEQQGVHFLAERTLVEAIDLIHKHQKIPKKNLYNEALRLLILAFSLPRYGEKNI
jgi:hypothetical protein